MGGVKGHDGRRGFASSFLVSRKPLPPVPGEEPKTEVTTEHTLLMDTSFTAQTYMYSSSFFLTQRLGPLPPPPTPAPDDEHDDEDEEEVVVAMYDFPGTEPHDLSLVKGGEYVILERCDLNWYKARNEYG